MYITHTVFDCGVKSQYVQHQAPRHGADGDRDEHGAGGDRDE